nr:MAG TPA: hypothetical protein [Caudoviricetes sp.]
MPCALGRPINSNTSERLGHTTKRTVNLPSRESLRTSLLRKAGFAS